MRVAELFAVNNITGVVADDQPEFFICGVLEVYVEDNVLIVGANILNSDLFVIELCFIILAAVSQTGEGIADKDNSCYGCYRNCFYYTAV